MKVISELTELEILVHNSFSCLIETLVVSWLHFMILFSEIMRQSWNLRWAISKTCQFISLQGICKLLIPFFLEYCCTIAFVHDISCPYQGCWCMHATNVHEILSTLNLLVFMNNKHQKVMSFNSPFNCLWWRQEK